MLNYVSISQTVLCILFVFCRYVLFLCILFCIFQVHWQRNGGRCGVCGDPWDAPTPRANEAGGVYGRGIIVRKYKPGQVIDN